VCRSRGAVLGFDMQAVEIIHGLLGMHDGAEGRAPLVFEHRKPACDIGCMFVADLRRNVEIGAEEWAGKLGNPAPRGRSLHRLNLSAVRSKKEEIIAYPAVTHS
jgi:hypothetical protein